MGIVKTVSKMQAWKFFLMLFIVFSFVIFGIEELVVSRVFHFMNGLVTQFQKNDQNDRADMDNDFKEAAEKIEKIKKAHSDPNAPYDDLAGWN